jgi:integrase
VRFRKGGFSTYFTGTPWGEDFMRQYAAALDGQKAQAENVGVERTQPGSINALCVSYYRLIFPALKPSTQALRRGVLEWLRRQFGDMPVARLQREHAAAIIAAKANTPAAANTLRMVLRHLLEHGIAIGMLTNNPAAHIKKLKIAGDGFHTWSEDEVARFEARHQFGTPAYLALHLLLDTAQRRSDVVKMGWQFVRGDKIAVRQEKTNTLLLIPIGPELARALDGVPRKNLTFLLAANGAPFTAIAFSKWFRKRCNEAGLPHCSAHGLRKLAATRLANEECGEREIMAITGHRSVAEVSRYTKQADQARLAEKAMLRLSRRVENKTGQEIVQHADSAGQKRRPSH